MRAKFILVTLRFFSLLSIDVNRMFGEFLGRILWFAQGRDAKVTVENLQRCFPEHSDCQTRSLAKASIIETAKLAFEIPWLWSASREAVSKKVLRIEGESYLQEAMKDGRGLIVLAPHFGNWEVVGRILITYGPVTSLYQPPKQAYLEPLIRSSRQQDGCVLVPTTSRGVAKLLAALKKGAISGILPDQCPDENGGELSEIFGCPAYTMTLVHGLIKRTNCSVVMAAAERVKGGFVLRFLPADKGIFSADVSQSLAAMNRSVEKCVMLAPEQYQWEYKRFRRTGTAENKPYQFKK